MRIVLAPGVRGMAAAALAALVGCASVPPTPAPAVRDGEFEMTGRFAARQGEDAGGGRITWRHTRAEDDLMLSSPLGQGLARITRRDGLYVLETGEDRRWESTDPGELAERVLGFSIPVQGLADWVLARPMQGRDADVERDADGRVQWIRQDGWKIEYPAYAGGLPQRIRVSRADFELRLSIDAWRPAN
jgi:outer membrane lipoprotein LolB